MEVKRATSPMPPDQSTNEPLLSGSGQFNGMSVQRKAAQVKVLRFRLFAGGGIGGESSNFDILRCWQRLTPGTLEKAQFIYTPKEAPALDTLAPGWNMRGLPSGIRTLTVHNVPCEFIPDHCLASLPVTEFSIVGSTTPRAIGNPLQSLRAKNCLSLQPYHWQTDDHVLLCATSLSEPPQEIQLILPAENHLPVMESDILSSQGEQHYTYYSGNDPCKIELVTQLICLAENRNISLGILYGLERAYRRSHTDSSGLIVDYLKAINNLQMNVPVVIYVANKVGDKVKKMVQEELTEHNIGFMDSFSNQKNHTFLQNLHSKKTNVIFGGRIPKVIFEKAVVVSHLPVILEGSNTAELCQCLGKPYLPIGFNSKPFPSNQKLNTIWNYSSILLSYSRESGCQAIAYFQDFKSKTHTVGIEAFIEVIQSNSEPCIYKYFPGGGTKHLPCAIRSFEGDAFELADALNSWFFFPDTHPGGCLCDLIPSFLKHEDILSQGTILQHSHEQHVQFISELLRSGTLEPFHEYLQQQSALLVTHFLQQTCDSTSPLAQYFKELEVQAHAPENNALVSALSQIPTDKMIPLSSPV